MHRIDSSTLDVFSTNSAPYINSGNPAAGQMWVRDGEIKVFDGYNWIPVMINTSVNLNASTQAALNWVYEKMREENRYRELAQKHVSVADALDEVQRAQEKLQVVIALCESPE